MTNEYHGVLTRFLREDERLVLSEEKELPLVLEASDCSDPDFLKQFLNIHSAKILDDIAHYGAILLRGFAVKSDEDFEQTVLSIQGLQGISEAFMSEEGRIHVGSLQYVLHTNAIYKTGGTAYLGGFHSENYYSPDVPSYIFFCCQQPSTMGGETGLLNTEKIYQELSPSLKEKLEKKNFFVAKWLVSEVAKRYKISSETIEAICKQFDLPVVGKGRDKFILMYKPNVFEHPLTKKKALQINLFEIAQLNEELRRCFMNDYSGKTWFWHRLIWRMPSSVFKIIEYIYIFFANLFYSPKNSLRILRAKIAIYSAVHKKNNLPPFDQQRVGTCFNGAETKTLAKLIRKHYSSCLWQKGDILLVDNRKVMHAGMPGAGPRLVRAMIANPVAMSYSQDQSGLLQCNYRKNEAIGHYMTSGESNS